MNSRTLMVALLPFIFPALASAQFRSGNALKTEFKGTEFTATVPAGFHFNEKAPNGITLDGKKVKPTHVEPRKLEFTDLAKGFKAGYANVYICDDALTYCEPRRVELGTQSPSQPTNSAKPVANKKAAKMKIDREGFILDDFNGAIEKAKREKKLVLVDFAARWCPGCMRLEKEVFVTSIFKKQSTPFVKVKIDVDRFENIVLSEKYKIRGIPTVIALDSEQAEIERFYDFQPVSAVSRFLDSVQKDPTPLSSLMAKGAGATSSENERIASRLLVAGEAEKSLAYFEKVTPQPAEALTARVAAAQSAFKADATTKPRYLGVLREAITADPTSTRALAWRTELVGLTSDVNEKKALVTDGVKNADALLDDRSKIAAATRGDLVGEFAGYEPLMVAINRADLVSAMDAESPAAKDAWKKAAAVGRSLKIKATDRGPAVRYLIILTAAEDYAEAAELSKTLLKADPNNPELLRRQLRALNGKKDFEQAIKVGQRALKESYGRNEYWVAEQLAKAYIGAGRKKEAGELLERFLNRTDADWSTVKPTLESMQKLRTSLGAGA